MTSHSSESELIIDLVDIVAYGEPHPDDGNRTEEIMSDCEPGKKSASSTSAEEMTEECAEDDSGVNAHEVSSSATYETASEYGMERYPGWIAYRSDESETMLTETVTETQSGAYAEAPSLLSVAREEDDAPEKHLSENEAGCTENDLGDGARNVLKKENSDIPYAMSSPPQSSEDPLGMPSSREGDVKEHTAACSTDFAASSVEDGSFETNDTIFATNENNCDSIRDVSAAGPALGQSEGIVTLKEESLPVMGADESGQDGLGVRILILEQRMTSLEKEVSALASRIAALEDTSSGHVETDDMPQRDDEDFEQHPVDGEFSQDVEDSSPGEPDILEQLTSLRVRVDALEALPPCPDEAVLVQNVLGTVRGEIDRYTSEQSASIIKILSEMQRRIRELETRPAPQLILPELPDVEGVVEAVLERLRGELDETVASAAAKVLREEIAALRKKTSQ